MMWQSNVKWAEGNTTTLTHSTKEEAEETVEYMLGAPFVVNAWVSEIKECHDLLDIVTAERDRLKLKLEAANRNYEELHCTYQTLSKDYDVLGEQKASLEVDIGVLKGKLQVKENSYADLEKCHRHLYAKKEVFGKEHTIAFLKENLKRFGA